MSGSHSCARKPNISLTTERNDALPQSPFRTVRPCIEPVSGVHPGQRQIDAGQDACFSTDPIRSAFQHPNDCTCPRPPYSGYGGNPPSCRRCAYGFWQSDVALPDGLDSNVCAAIICDSIASISAVLYPALSGFPSACRHFRPQVVIYRRPVPRPLGFCGPERICASPSGRGWRRLSANHGISTAIAAYH